MNSIFISCFVIAGIIVPSLSASVSVSVASPFFPSIILINPFLDENVGQCAKNMHSFGLRELRVVAPICNILSERSKFAAEIDAVDILQNAKVFTTPQEAIADLQYVMATTIRPRHMTQTILSPAKAAEILVRP